MSWQDVRHWYEERDDETDEPPVKLVCSVCGKVVWDPPGATREESIDDCSAECLAKRKAWEEQRIADEQAAYAAVWAEEAKHMETHCQWCGREASREVLTAGSGVCRECRGQMDHVTAEAAQDGEAFSGDTIPW